MRKYHVIGRFAAALTAGLVAAQDPTPSKPAYPVSALRPLQKLTIDLCALGRKDEATTSCEILAGLGFPAKELARADARMAKTRRVTRGIAKQTERLAEQAQRIGARLARDLDKITDAATRQRAATELLRLDHTLAGPHRLLGHQLVDGRWLSAEQAAFVERNSEIQSAIQAVRRLQVEVETKVSDHPLLQHVYGAPGHTVTWRGLTVSSCWPAAKLRRVVENAVRAVALSRYLIDGGQVALPDRLDLRLIQLTFLPEYKKALAFDVAGNRVSALEARRAKDRSLYRRSDSFLVNCDATENQALATVFCFVIGLPHESLHGKVEHATFVVGHANWVLLALTGATIPGIAYFTSSQGPGTAATSREDAEKMLMGAGLMGARSWLRHRVQDGTDPPWPRSFKAQVGMISGEDLLKTTFVAEYLHLFGPLRPLLQRSAKGIGKDPTAVMQSIEQAVGAKIPAFEAAWRGWMAGGSGGNSVVAALGGSSSGPNKVERSVLKILADLRDRAHTHAYLRDLPTLALDRALSDGAGLHARYLELHPDQAARWPAAHEEYTDQQGFTPAGCWAGAHSVINPGAADPNEAINGWMGTYFHRLPLLDPGLLQVGWGAHGSTAVLDCASVVRQLDFTWEVAWPPDGTRDVPRSFRPELPSPFPGQDQSVWGYPITLQLGPGQKGHVPEITLTLRRGGARGEVVAAQVSSPQRPGNEKLVPALTWCLIPEAQLQANSAYYVTAEIDDPARTLTWSFETGKTR
jgi:hypothetical protein